MKRAVSLAMLLGVLLGSGVLTGCNDPTARRKTAQREKRIAYWLGQAVARERAGAAKVDAGLREVGRVWRKDESSTRQNHRGLEALTRQQNRRWRDRQPGFKTQIEQQLAGKPKNIRRVAIDMFF